MNNDQIVADLRDALRACHTAIKLHDIERKKKDAAWMLLQQVAKGILEGSFSSTSTEGSRMAYLIGVMSSTFNEKEPSDNLIEIVRNIEERNAELFAEPWFKEPAQDVYEKAKQALEKEFQAREDARILKEAMDARIANATPAENL